MAYRDLRDFQDRLEGAGELHRVRVEVDPALEIAEIADRVSKMKDGGKALLFEKVKGGRFAVAANLFGSPRRMCLALELNELSDLSRRLEQFLKGLPPGAEASWWSHLGFAPQQTQEAPCQEVVEVTPGLGAYPFLKSWPGDSGPTVTLPLVFTEDPETGRANCGMYRVQILDRSSVAVHWHPQSGGACHHRKYLERGEPMPVAVAIGGDPAVIYAASLPLPEPVDEMQFAGYLRRSPVQLVRCLTVPLMVPANAEMVIEGYVEPGGLITGSVFGNHTGFYAPAPDAPVLRVTCITRRRDPVFPVTVVGRPPMEDCQMAKATERVMLPFLRRELPEIADLNLPLEWIFHNGAVVSINKSYPGHAGEVMHLLRNGRWMRNARSLVVVDADVDLQDLSLVAWKTLNNVDWQRDLVIGGAGIGRATSDRTLPGSGTFLGIDATRKWAEERSGSEWPREIAMDETVKRLVDSRWREYGF